jgi:GDPmannose 4,6-dehydratase
MKHKKNKKIALIVGSGVIGAYLAKVLVKKNFKTIITTRKLKNYKKNYNKLNITNKVKFVKLNLNHKEKISEILKNNQPDLIYYFAGQRSIPESFIKPRSTYLSNCIGAENFLKIINKEKLNTKFFKANSGYIFNGDKNKITLSSKLIKPDSPYTRSQIDSYKLIKKYRLLGLNCYSLIFFNIESKISSKDFVAKKICYTCREIKKNRLKKIVLGNINTIRDFSWAPEIVNGIYLIKNLKPQDIIMGSGIPMKIKDFIFHAFNFYKLDYKKYITFNKKFFRKNERLKIVASMKETLLLLSKWNWRTKIIGKKLVYKMCKELD